MAENGKICIELVFSRGNSVSIKDKVHEFWSFLDEESRLLLEYGQRPSLLKPRTASIVTLRSNCGSDDDQHCGKIWHKEFKIFRHLGLDKAALAVKEPCAKCYADTKCSDYADSGDRTYEELSEEMEAFDRKTSNL